MHVLGLLGGVASGKSLVAKQLQSLGAALLDGDRAGHEVLAEPEVQAALRRRWGEGVFLPDGAVHRPAVARIVFAPTPEGALELKFLEELTHPRIAVRLTEQLAAARAAGAPAVVLDAPVMVRAGWHKLCDHVLFVAADEVTRLARAKQRGWDEAEFRRREAAQETIDEKKSLSDAVIDNSGSPEATLAQVKEFWRRRVNPAA